MRILVTLTLLLLSLAGAAAAADTPPGAAPALNADARPDLLKALDGRWIMSGDVMGKPVTYDMVAAPTLHNTFTELHMIDVQMPSKYEARVLIGADRDGQSVIAHWMDSFGARASIPHATGAISGNQIEFTFAYKSAPFRDTFTRSPESDSWTLVIEAAQADGSWKHFARYTMRRN
jgi:hypothetical protein